jgi:hypothetical protein
MAEAAALALVAEITERLNLNNINCSISIAQIFQHHQDGRSSI